MSVRCRCYAKYAVADPGEGPGEVPPPPYSWTTLRPEGPTKIFWGDQRSPAPPSQGADPALVCPEYHDLDSLHPGHCDCLRLPLRSAIIMIIILS